MKNFFSCLLAAVTMSVLSFRKMEESGVFKEINLPEFHLMFVCNGDQTNEMDNFIYDVVRTNKVNGYFGYLYDPISKYILLQNLGSGGYNSLDKESKFYFTKYCFNILTGINYPNLKEAKESYGIVIKEPSLLKYYNSYGYSGESLHFIEFAMRHFVPFLSFIDTDPSPTNIRQWVENSNNHEKSWGSILCGSDLVREKYFNGLAWKANFFSDLGIEVNCTVEGVKLTKVLRNGKKKTIDFQEALGEHLKRQRFLSDTLSQPLIEFLNLKEKKPHEANVEICKTVSLLDKFIAKKEKLCLTDNEIEKQEELLKNSEILMIRFILPNKNVTDLDCKKDPSKCTIIGTGIDKRNLTTFHWVTELSEKMEELFES